MPEASDHEGDVALIACLSAQMSRLCRHGWCPPWEWCWRLDALNV